MSVASPGILPGNLLSLADQDFETGIGSWTVAFNGSGIAQSSAWSFTGTKSLTWLGSGTGNSQVSTGSYPVIAGRPYATSLVINPGATRACQIGIAWFTAGSVFISNSINTAVTVAANTPTPLSLATVAPATAAIGKVFAQVNAAANLEVEMIDFVYFAQTSVQVLCDWLHSPFFAGSTAGSSFFDLTPWVPIDRGMDFGRGRQDAVSTVQAGSASFTAYNTPGWFTANDSASPWYGNIKLGRRLQINVADEAGAWHTRFDGPVSGIDYEYDEVGNSHALISGADVLAFLDRQNKLSCWTREQVLLDGPSLHWALDEPSGQVAYESSGNNGPPLRLRTYGAPAATFAFASGNGGVETQANAPNTTTLGDSASPLPSPFFTTQEIHTFGQAQTSSAQLGGAIPPISTRTGSNFAVEFWVTLDPTQFTGGGFYNLTTSSHLLCMLTLGDSRTGKNLTFSLDPSNGIGKAWNVSTFPGPLGAFPYIAAPPTIWPPIATLAVAATPFPDGGVPIHFAANVVGNDSGATLTLFINGVSSGTLALPKFFTPNWIDVGGLYGGYGGWQGNVSLVSIYPNTVPGANFTTHAGVGTAGMYRSSTSAGAIVAAAFAGLPPFWSNLGAASSLSLADYVDLTGSSALSSMQTFEQAEVAGLLYVNAAGQVCFDGRQVRMGASAPALTLPAGSYSSDLGYKLTDQYLITSAAVAAPVTFKAAVAANVAAEQDYGPYTSGTPASPNTIPVQSQSPQFTLRGLQAYSTQLDPYLNDVAAWQTFRLSTPPFKAASITVDVATLKDATSGAYVALSALYGVDINSTIKLGGTVTAFPDDSGALDMFIEGVTEHIDESSHTITFYTSPAKLVRCWKPGDATYGALDSTAVIGISDRMTHANGPRSKIHADDPGPPFWPPTYATAMNNGGVSGKGFVGATDQRGIWHTLQTLQQPPLLVAGQSVNQQSFSSGTGAAEQTMQWDTIYVDNLGGMGITPSFPNWYVVMVPGFYELHCTILWVANATGNRFARFVVNPSGVVQGPLGAAALSVAGTSRRPIAGTPTGVTISTRLYCGIGTTIGVRCWQDSGGALLTGIATANGSVFSVTFTGYSTSAD